VIARQTAMYFAKNHTNLSLKAIGYHFGKRDHTTVLHAIESVNNMIDTDKEFKNGIAELQKRLKFSR
jgi:chromosomal replication initiator protein